ncbi:MAG: hypothetical protein ACK55Z_12890 [bacterium]
MKGAVSIETEIGRVARLGNVAVATGRGVQVTPSFGAMEEGGQASIF